MSLLHGVDVPELDAGSARPGDVDDGKSCTFRRECETRRQIVSGIHRGDERSGADIPDLNKHLVDSVLKRGSKNLTICRKRNTCDRASNRFKIFQHTRSGIAKYRTSVTARGHPLSIWRIRNRLGAKDGGDSPLQGKCYLRARCSRRYSYKI